MFSLEIEKKNQLFNQTRGPADIHTFEFSPDTTECFVCLREIIDVIADLFAK